ncbi:MAG: hypothetical protein ACW97A_05885 [Candidatus Thorarchaeota archaeon]|jgi:hypothetical protein
MQQVELFTVAAILWGGIFVFLLYLYMRMSSLRKSVKSLESSLGED